MHEIHECCWRIRQSKGHHRKLKVPITRPKHCLRDIFSYVLITKHTNNHNTYNMVYTPFIKHSHVHTSFIKQSPKTHACSVLVLSCDFLGNLIPKLNIEPHLVVMFLHYYGLSPIPQSLGFHIPILYIKPPNW